MAFETFADLEPEDEDWSLILWLRHHSSLFAALFGRANSLSWHCFWLQKLAPVAMAERDAARLTSLVLRSGSRLEEDADGVFSYWLQILECEWIDQSRIAMNMALDIASYKGKPSTFLLPVIRKLLALPRSKHDPLGEAIFKAIEIGCADDELLWQYITADVTEEVILQFQLDQKLQCDPHAFAKSGQLSSRMKASDRLLDLAIGALEHWRAQSEARHRSSSEWTEGHLGSTSYQFAHSTSEIHHVSSEDVLLRAIEEGVLERAKQNSTWWIENKRRLASSREGAMRYWVIKALVQDPTLDLDLVTQLLSQQQMLTEGLSHEIGDLLHVATPLMSASQLDKVLATVTAIADQQGQSERYRYEWSKQIKAIPAIYRTANLQAALDDVEVRWGSVLREPVTRSTDSFIRPPFSFDKFLDADDEGVLRLLKHYENHLPSPWDWDDDHVGGVREVGGQLSEAASRAPNRFMALLASHWCDIPEKYREDIFSGCASGMDLKSGKLHDSSEAWKPVETIDIESLALLVLDELERHPIFWHGHRTKAKALRAVSTHINLDDVDRFAFQLLALLRCDDPDHYPDLLMTGINSTQGVAAIAAIEAATHLAKNGHELSPLLLNALRRFCMGSYLAARAMILRQLAYFTSLEPPLGWELFDLCMADNSAELWKFAEPCLYWAYSDNYQKVEPCLERMFLIGQGEDEQDLDDKDRRSAPKVLSTWGRIASLASLSGHVEQRLLVSSLIELGRRDAWRGATSVWIANAHIPEHTQACFYGLQVALAMPLCAEATANAMERLFSKEKAFMSIPDDLIKAMFDALPVKQNGGHYFANDFAPWLETAVISFPDAALSAFEHLAHFLERSGNELYDRGPGVRALTGLFREAEEREQSDNGAMLLRVLGLQDSLSSKMFGSLDQWLKDAERP